MLKIAIKITLFTLFLILLTVYWQKQSLDNQIKNANLIIISADALRADHMGIYGYNKNTTPNIDRWSKEAFVFDQAMTVIPITYPSFAALFTGLHPVDTKIIKNATNEPIPDNVQTLTSILKKNGFTNASFLTSDVLNKDVNKDLTNLVKDFEVYESFPYKTDQGNYYKDYEEFIDKAFSWLTNNKDKRQFMWLHFMNTHSPYYPPSGYRCVFNKIYCKQIENAGEQELFDEEQKLRGCQEQPVPEDTISLHETLYDGEIAYMDKLFGDLIDRLKKNHIDKNTVVVFLADHGEGFDHNYNFLHGQVLYQSSVQIPLIIKIPWLNSHGRQITDLVDNTDIMPTLINLLQLKTDNLIIDGKSFNTVFNNKSKTDKHFVYSVTANMDKYAIFDGKYKYIYSLSDSCLADGQPNEEVYNVIADQNEENNLFINNSQVNKNLKEDLMLFLSKYNLPQTTTKNIDNLNKGSSQLDRLKSLGY